MIKKTALLACLLPLISLSYFSCGSYKLSTVKKKLDKETVVASKDFTEKIKFRWDNLIDIPVTINGENNSRRFVLSTGSPSYITYETKDKINVESERVSGKLVKMEYCNMPMKVGNVSYSKAGCMVMN